MRCGSGIAARLLHAGGNFEVRGRRSTPTYGYPPNKNTLLARHMDFITGNTSSDEDVEVGSASDPQEVNTLSSEMEDAQKDHVQDVQPDKDDSGAVVGDDFKVEWTDQFTIPISSVQSRLFQYNSRQEGGTHHWKGIDWTVLMLVESERRALGLFVGYNNPDQLPPGRKLHLKFLFQLLDLEDNVVYECKSQRSPSGSRPSIYDLFLFLICVQPLLFRMSSSTP